MNGVPILDMKKGQSLAKNLGLVICLNSETLLGIEASTKTLFQLAQDIFNHWVPQVTSDF